MADFFHPMTEQIAAKTYRCINCGEHIENGERYCKQSGVYDGSYYTNRFHPECFDSLCEEDEFVFVPYSGERPQKETQP